MNQLLNCCWFNPVVNINCVFSNELGYGWFKWSFNHFNKMYVVSLGKLFLVRDLGGCSMLLLPASGLASSRSECAFGDVGRTARGLLSRPGLFRPADKTLLALNLCWFKDWAVY